MFFLKMETPFKSIWKKINNHREWTWFLWFVKCKLLSLGRCPQIKLWSITIYFVGASIINTTVVQRILYRETVFVETKFNSKSREHLDVPDFFTDVCWAYWVWCNQRGAQLVLHYSDGVQYTFVGPRNLNVDLKCYSYSSIVWSIH